MAKLKKGKYTAVHMNADVAREIRQHARSQSKTEVCGVLVGAESEGVTRIEACISGANAAQGGTHVTFTQDTWEHIYKIKDRDFPNQRIVGWYHSHPGFGVFLSDHDTFIHKNFFSSPQQVAWVYDPHSDEEGCFGWNGGRLERLTQFEIVDSRGGEVAGGSGKPEPTLRSDQSDVGDWEEHVPRKTSKDEELSKLTNIVSTVFSHLAVFVLGGLLVWYLLPRILVMPVPVDPITGRPIHNSREAPDDKSATPGAGQHQSQTDGKPNSPDQPKAPGSGPQREHVQR
jgi:proteasome lid subunit RPN8/RPN11